MKSSTDWLPACSSEIPDGRHSIEIKGELRETGVLMRFSLKVKNQFFVKGRCSQRHGNRSEH